MLSPGKGASWLRTIAGVDISMAEIESIVEPDGVTDHIWWKSVTFLSIHTPILAISGC